MRKVCEPDVAVREDGVQPAGENQINASDTNAAASRFAFANKQSLPTVARILEMPMRKWPFGQV